MEPLYIKIIILYIDSPCIFQPFLKLFLYLLFPFLVLKYEIITITIFFMLILLIIIYRVTQIDAYYAICFQILSIVPSIYQK